METTGKGAPQVKKKVAKRSGWDGSRGTPQAFLEADLMVRSLYKRFRGDRGIRLFVGRHAMKRASK
jgi:hypothetical protein